MKTASLFENLRKLLSEQPRQDRYDLSTVDDINTLEHDICAYKIGKLLAACGEEASIESLQPFVEFLRHRAEYVSEYPDNHFYSTPLCFALADALSKVVGVNRYQLLRPSISVTYNNISSTELESCELQNNEFILSDDLQSIIEVEPCLRLAEEDGILKHTRTFAGSDEEKLPLDMKKLSSYEEKRLLATSAEAQNYFDQIHSTLQIKKNGASIGAFLHRLIDKLHSGSTKRKKGGVELIAGQDANEGIEEFFQFMNMLEETVYLEFGTENPELAEAKPNGYFLSYSDKAWQLTYLNLKKEAELISISDVSISQCSWNIELDRSVSKEIELDEILKDATPTNLTAEAKLKITELFKSWHYKTRPADGSEKGQFYSCHAKGRNIKFYCDLLANPYKEADTADPNKLELALRFCVKTIADELKAILDVNKTLYDTFPKNQGLVKQMGVAVAERALIETKKDLINSQKNHTASLTTNLTYDQKFSLLRQMFAEIVTDRNEEFSVPFKHQLYNILYDFFYGLLRDPKTYAAIDDIHKLCFALDILPFNWRFTLLGGVASKLEQLIPDTRALARAEAFFPNHYRSFIAYFKAEHLSGLSDKMEISDVASLIKSSPYVAKCLAPQRLFERVNHFKHCLQEIASDTPHLHKRTR